MDDLLDRLRAFDALRDVLGGDRVDKVLTRAVDRCAPDFAPEDALNAFPNWLRTALEAQGIRRLYAHQAEAIERIWAGEDVVLEAPTASGKTLCFNAHCL